MDSTEGRLLIDGKNITDCDLKALRQQITFIAQKPCLVPGSVRENLTENVDPSDTESRLQTILEIFFDINFLRCRELHGDKEHIFK